MVWDITVIITKEFELQKIGQRTTGKFEYISYECKGNFDYS